MHTRAGARVLAQRRKLQPLQAWEGGRVFSHAWGLLGPRKKAAPGLRHLTQPVPTPRTACEHSSLRRPTSTGLPYCLPIYSLHTAAPGASCKQAFPPTPLPGVCTAGHGAPPGGAQHRGDPAPGRLAPPSRAPVPPSHSLAALPWDPYFPQEGSAMWPGVRGTLSPP